MFTAKSEGIFRDAGYSKPGDQWFKTEPSDIDTWKNLSGSGRLAAYSILADSSRNMPSGYSGAIRMFFCID
jgi:hypothetical protein